MFYQTTQKNGRSAFGPKSRSKSNTKLGLPLFSNPSRQGFGFYLWRTTLVSDLGGGFLSTARCLSALQRRFLSAIIPPNLKGQAFCARPCIMVTTSHQREFLVNDEIVIACLDLVNFDVEFWVYALGMMGFYSSRITIWDPGGIHSWKAVQGDLIHRSRDHDNSSFSVVDNYLWDFGMLQKYFWILLEVI